MYVINFANTNFVFSYKKWSKTERRHWQRDAKVMKCTQLQIGELLHLLQNLWLLKRNFTTICNDIEGLKKLKQNSSCMTIT